MERKKGKSLLKFVDDYTVVDIETTGNSLYYDKILEISAAKYRSNQLVAQFSSLVQCNRKISSFITELTGINNEMLADAPELSDVLRDFIDFVGNDIILGHNVNFDINFLYDSIASTFDYCLNNDFIDTLRLSRRILRFLENHRLSTIAYHFVV